MTVYLHGFGSFLPDRVVTNAELAARVSRTPEWIASVSGIQERRWAARETTVADMAVAAAEACLKNEGGVSVGMLIVASGSASRGFPGPAPEVARRLGFGEIPALDLPIASAGGIFELDLARRCAPDYGDVLIVASEKMSEVISREPLDPNTSILFGDGAGAAVVSPRPGKWKILDSAIHTDGQYAEDLKYDGAGALVMNGLTVIMQASRKLPAVIREVLDRRKIAATDVAAFLLHQANLNLLTRVGKTLGVPPERIFTNVERYGNTSSASMLIAADEWSAQNPNADGPVVMAAFGAGFHWGALVAEPSR
jgi:3-oxoacyl-[acyl-carrier-protein] synthase-3